MVSDPLSPQAPELPTTERIREKAIEMFVEDRVRAGLPAITPEDHELKEESYWEKARRELMSGVQSELEEYLAYLESEMRKIRDTLGVAPPPEMEELKRQFEDLQGRYKRTREELKKARREVEEAERLRREAEEREKEIERLKAEAERLRIAKIVTLRLKKDVPAFVGADMKQYGPFRAGDIAALPEANAAILIERGVAEPWVVAVPKPPVKPEERPLREFPEQKTALRSGLESEARMSLIVAHFPEEIWLANRGTIIREIESAIAEYEEQPKLTAEQKIRDRVSKYVSSLIERLKVPPPGVIPPVVFPTVPIAVPPAVEIVYAPREKPITPEEMKDIGRALKVPTMGDLLDKVLKGEVKPEAVKKVHDELMMKRRVEKRE